MKPVLEDVYIDPVAIGRAKSERGWAIDKYRTWLCRTAVSLSDVWRSEGLTKFSANSQLEPSVWAVLGYSNQASLIQYFADQRSAMNELACLTLAELHGDCYVVRLGVVL